MDLQYYKMQVFVVVLMIATMITKSTTTTITGGKESPCVLSNPKSLDPKSSLLSASDLYSRCLIFALEDNWSRIF